MYTSYYTWHSRCIIRVLHLGQSVHFCPLWVLSARGNSCYMSHDIEWWYSGLMVMEVFWKSFSNQKKYGEIMFRECFSGSSTGLGGSTWYYWIDGIAEPNNVLLSKWKIGNICFQWWVMNEFSLCLHRRICSWQLRCLLIPWCHLVSKTYDLSSILAKISVLHYIERGVRYACTWLLYALELSKAEHYIIMLALSSFLMQW